MSPIALGMNLVLALLLLSALGLGMRLERKLKALRAGQDQFVGAVADLDRAARRAEAGLADLRQATEEAVDLLAGRIEKARELANKLEKYTADAARPVAVARQAAAPTRLQAERAMTDRPAADRLTLDRAPAAPARRDRPSLAAQPPLRRRPEPELDMDRIEAAAEDLVLRLTETEMLARSTQPVRREPAADLRQDPRMAPRSRASIDDDLFDAAPRGRAGARR